MSSGGSLFSSPLFRRTSSSSFHQRSPLESIDGNSNRESLSAKLKGLLISTRKSTIIKNDTFEVPTPSIGSLSVIKSDGNREGSTDNGTPLYSLSNIDQYDSDLHLPKYSQSEMDSAVEESAAVITELKLEIKKLTSIVSSHSPPSNKVSSVSKDDLLLLERSLEEERERNRTLNEKMEEFVLMRMQNRALNQRLLSLETELQEKDSMSEKIVASVMADSSKRLKEVEESFATKLALAQEEAKRDVKHKAQMQFEAGNEKFNAIKQDFKELRFKYDEKISELKSLKDKHDELLSNLDSATLLNQVKINEIDDLKTQIEALKQDKSSLISASVSSQTSAASMQDAVNKVKDELYLEKKNVMVMKASMGELENQLRSTKIELEGQLSTIARLTAGKVAAETQLEQTKVEAAELGARCHKLREMNKEMLAMLEGQQTS